MAIHDIETFTKTLKDLLEYYHKPCNDTASSVWLSVCNESLSDEEFSEAVALCFRRFDRLPSLDEFIGLIHGDKEAIAELAIGEAWEKIMQAAAISSSDRQEHIEFKRKAFNSLTPAQAHALYQLGGFDRLGRCPAEDLIWRRREYTQMCKLYEQANRTVQGAARRLNAMEGTGDSNLPRSNGFSSLGESLF